MPKPDKDRLKMRDHGIFMDFQVQAFLLLKKSAIYSMKYFLNSA